MKPHWTFAALSWIGTVALVGLCAAPARAEPTLTAGAARPRREGAAMPATWGRTRVPRHVAASREAPRAAPRPSAAAGPSTPRTSSGPAAPVLSPARLELVLPARPLEAAPSLSTPLGLRLPPPAPASFELRLGLGPLVDLYLGADLRGDARPRPDAVDGETYFTAGGELRLTPGVGVFLEDFQPASTFVGAASDEPAPRSRWDGHQVGLGLRWRQGRIQVQAGAVFAVLSATRRSEGVGALAELSLRF